MARVSPYESMLELNRTVAPCCTPCHFATACLDYWNSSASHCRTPGRGTKHFFSTTWTCLFGVSSSIRIGFLAISCYISGKNNMVLICFNPFPAYTTQTTWIAAAPRLRHPETPRPNGPARHPPLSAAAGSARLAAGRCQSPWGRPRWPNEAHGSPRSLMISRGWDHV